MKILLVEDEPPILRDVQSQLQSYPHPSLCVFTASNGHQALDLLASGTDKIDLLITDIEMPLMNGLELITAVKKRYPHIACIILSGYSDFSYAKQAIHLGVTEYLLKPVEEEALFSLLKRMIAKKHREYLEQTLKDPSIAPPQTEAAYITTIICIGSLSIHSHEYNRKRSLQWQQLNLERKLELLRSNYMDFLLVDGKTVSEKNLIITIKNSDISSLIPQLFRLCTELSIPISIAYHPVGLAMKDIGQSFHRLRQVLSHEILIGKSRLIQDTAPESSLPEQYAKQLHLIIADLCSFFTNLQLKPFETLFRKMIQLLQDASCTQHLVFHYIHKLVRDCLELQSVKNKLYFDCVDCIWDSIALSDSFQELYENMSSIFRDMFETLCNQQENTISKDHLMLTVDAYIKEHYNQPINAQTLSEEFHFTPAYLSKLFRDYRSLSPTDYITELRINKAQELLSSDEGLKIRQISAMVGYEDPMYFSKVFKKITSQTPKQYLAAHQKEDSI